jgi:hypothetical protein
MLKAGEEASQPEEPTAGHEHQQEKVQRHRQGLIQIQEIE